MKLDCYNGAKVFITGHTGFKGSWLCEWLLSLGAKVCGFALEPPTKPALFDQLNLSERITSHMIGDIRNRAALERAVVEFQPDFVFHLAAQPIVRLSYREPVETFETNVMGTVHLLEACRRLDKKCNVVCVTTDKCYENLENGRAYVETDPMGGYDPYSCSKGCDELIISSYRRSFFGNPESNVWVASARAGNVIGGGDWAQDRIVPDTMRALEKGISIPVRNKISTRPWQHVLEPLSGYLVLGAALSTRRKFEDYSSGFNFGPNPSANRTVKDLVVEILRHRQGDWEDKCDLNAVHEAGLLNLDISKADRVLDWKPNWNFDITVEKTVLWYVAVANGCDAKVITGNQIQEYINESRRIKS